MFFPATAYAQVKVIPDPLLDFRNRLLTDFARDIRAAHAFLARAPGGGQRARLVRVSSPPGLAHLVPVATCANRVAYWELPNARVIFADAHGLVRSFGIASLISWRGVWYVVHLGAVVPAGAVGTVDDPAVGQGVSAASSTC